MKKIFTVSFLLIFFTKCSYNYNEVFTVGSKSNTNYLVLNIENGYTTRLQNMEVQIPKNWKPYFRNNRYVHSPYKYEFKDTVVENMAKISLNIGKPKFFNVNKRLISKDSIHYYNTLWSVYNPDPKKHSTRIFEGENSNGKYFINDTRYNSNKVPRRVLLMTYYNKSTIYSIRFHSTEKVLDSFHNDAMKIFESVKIDTNLIPRIKKQDLHIRF